MSKVRSPLWYNFKLFYAFWSYTHMVQATFESGLFILYSACVLVGVCILLKSTGEGEWGRSGRFVCSLQETVSSFSTLYSSCTGLLNNVHFIRALYAKLSFQNKSNPLIPSSHSRQHTFCCLIQYRVYGPAYTPIIEHGTISNLL